MKMKVENESVVKRVYVTEAVRPSFFVFFEVKNRKIKVQYHKVGWMGKFEIKKEIIVRVEG
jgi:hypothetical protein